MWYLKNKLMLKKFLFWTVPAEPDLTDYQPRRFGVRPVNLILLFIFVVCLIGFPGLAEKEQLKSSQKVSDLLMEAKAALEDELYQLAQQKIEIALRTMEGMPQEQRESTILLAKALYGQKQYRDMINLLSASRKQASGTSQADAFDFWLAMAYFESAQMTQVLDCIQDFDKNYPASPYLPHVIRLRAKSYEQQGKHEEAIKCFANFDGNYGKSKEGPQNMLDWSRALTLAGYDNEARNVLERLLALNLENRVGQECRIGLGQSYFRKGNRKKAHQIFTALMKQKNVPAEFRAAAVYSLAEIAEAQTNLVEALSLLDTGIKQFSDTALNGEGNLRKGKLLLKMGKIDDGVALVRVFVSSQSTNTMAQDVQMELAQTLLNMGLNEKALVEYQNFLEAFSDPEGIARANEGKGWALFALKRYLESIASFKKACGLSSVPGDKARCLFKVGDCQFAAGQFESAMKSYGQVMAECPETPMADQAQFQLAECRAQSGDIAEAEALFWELIDKDTRSSLAAPAFLRIAELEIKQGKWKDARGVYNLVLNNYEGHIRDSAFYGLGMLHYQSGDFNKALSYFQQVVDELSDSKISDVACYMCGWCYYMLKWDAEAVKQFKEFVKKYPRSQWAADAIFWMGEYDYNQGAYAKAETGFITLVRDYPKSSVADTALFWAGRAALMQNEFSRANNSFSMLIKDYPNSRKRPEARFYQGEALCELGEFAGAILIFNEIIKQFPESYLAEMAWFRKGDSHFTLGSKDSERYEEAIKSYQVIISRPDVSGQSKMQAEYKIGRCLEKLDRRTEAFEHYVNVVYSYFRNQDRSPQSNVWFTRAAFNAAEMKEQEKSWGKAVNIYERVINADIPASQDARERINKIRIDHWLFFY